MSAARKRTIAVVGATGSQGSGVVRALQASGEFRVRALTRNRAKHEGIADEVVEADLNSPDTLEAALEGAYGVFAVTNAWEPGGVDEVAQGKAMIKAAKDLGVKHFVWSTLPNVEAISRGKYDVVHFTNKAKVDAAVRAAGFQHHTFVVAPFYYQNFFKGLPPQKQQDGSMGWTLPLDPGVRSIHMGDISELGNLVAGAFANPDIAGNGEYLPLVGDFLSFDAIVATLNSQGHDYNVNQVPAEVFANFFPGAREFAEMFGYFEKHTYLGAESTERIALANKVAGKRATDFASWAQANMPATAAAP